MYPLHLTYLKHPDKNHSDIHSTQEEIEPTTFSLWGMSTVPRLPAVKWPTVHWMISYSGINRKYNFSKLFSTQRALYSVMKRRHLTESPKVRRWLRGMNCDCTKTKWRNKGIEWENERTPRERKRERLIPNKSGLGPDKTSHNAVQSPVSPGWGNQEANTLISHSTHLSAVCKQHTLANSRRRNQDGRAWR